MAGDDRARRAARRAGDHDVQGQGPDPRRPPARRRRARALRHAGRELDHERGRPACSCSARRSPTTRGSTPATRSIQVDFDPLQLGKFHPVDVPGVGRDRGRRRAAAARRPARRRSRPTTRPRSCAERWAIWRAEKASRATDDRGHGVNSRRGVRRPGAPDPGRRGDRRRRRQPRLLVRALLRVQAPDRADVGLPRLDRLRLPGGDGRLGRGGRRAPDRRRDRRRRLRPVHGRGHHRGQARHEHHPRPAQQRPARQDLQGAARRRVGRVADLAAQPRLRARTRRNCGALGDPGDRPRRARRRAGPRPSPTTGRRWSR